MLLTQCKTPIAIVLLGVLDQKNILRFPSDAPETPGLMFIPENLLPINEQMMDIAKKKIDLKSRLVIDICQEFVGELKLTDGRLASLYLASVNDSPDLIQDNWLTLPDLLRLMPKTKNRLTYLKAWQVLTGALTLNTKVIEEEEMIRHIENDKKRLH